MSASTLTAFAAQNASIGTLSVVGGTGTYTFTLNDNYFSTTQVAGTNGVNLQAGSTALDPGSVSISVHADNGAGSTFDKTLIITATDPTNGGIALTTLNKFNVLSRDLSTKKHDFGSDTFKFMLTNSAPVATNAVKGDITDISAGNGYTAGGSATALTLTNTSGVEKIAGSAVTFLAAGGSIGPFRYVVLYNDTQTSPSKPLIGWADFGVALTLSDTQSFTVTPDATNGLLTVT